MIGKIFLVLWHLQAWHGDVETPEMRQIRLQTTAEAIDSAADGNDQLAALLIMTGYEETRFARHIHEGKCGQHPKSPKNECDSGRAGTPWQIQHGSWLPKEKWEEMIGVDLGSTEKAAKYAAGLLERGRRYCGSVEGAISLYATGHRCGWIKARPRYLVWLRVLRKLRASEETTARPGPRSASLRFGVGHEHSPSGSPDSTIASWFDTPRTPRW